MLINYENEKRSLRAFIEVMVILFVMIAITIIDKRLAGVASILPIIYFIIESIVRRRNNSRITTLLSDLKRSWYWILIVTVGFQTLYMLLFINVFPEMTEHLTARVPLLEESISLKILITFLIAALGEEIVFRGLFQERFSWYMKRYIAIPLTSTIFALMHFSDGDALIVGLDMTTIFLDSVIFGIIYYRTKNIMVCWFAHAAANIIAFLYITNIMVTG